jgi:hypothetical protein
LTAKQITQKLKAKNRTPMNSIQAKVLGSFLLLAGLSALGYGGYELWLAWDHNSSLSEADKAVGGLLSSFTNAIGADPRMSYNLGAIITGVGLIVSYLGWITLGKIK